MSHALQKQINYRMRTTICFRLAVAVHASRTKPKRSRWKTTRTKLWHPSQSQSKENFWRPTAPFTFGLAYLSTRAIKWPNTNRPKPQFSVVSSDSQSCREKRRTSSRFAMSTSCGANSTPVAAVCLRWVSESTSDSLRVNGNAH